VRQSSSYDPFVASSGDRPRFQPGNEYRGRIGLDHALGTGRFAAALTYSRFGDDNIGGSIYNTGDRYIAQIGFNDSFGATSVLVNAWNLYRRSGTIFTGERTGPENIANVLFGVGFGSLGGTLEPSLELRDWTQENLSPSVLGTAGIRYSASVAGFAITPSAGYTFGRYAATTGIADMSGYHAVIAIRWGP
jgi:hypothetical protein